MTIQFRIRETFECGEKYFFAEKFEESISDPPKSNRWRNVNSDLTCYGSYDRAKQAVLDYIESRTMPVETIHELPELTIYVKDK
jgi:hypothetical protein